MLSRSAIQESVLGAGSAPFTVLLSSSLFWNSAALLLARVPWKEGVGRGVGRGSPA
jgi:hypothetical protein